MVLSPSKILSGGGKIEDVYAELRKNVVLYDSPVTTSNRPTTYTLKGNAFDYESLEVHYRNNNEIGEVKTVKLSPSTASTYPNSFLLFLVITSGTAPTNNGMWFQSVMYKVSDDGKTITVTKGTQVFAENGSITHYNSTNLYIEKIVGIPK